MKTPRRQASNSARLSISASVTKYTEDSQDSELSDLAQSSEKEYSNDETHLTEPSVAGDAEEPEASEEEIKPKKKRAKKAAATPKATKGKKKAAVTEGDSAEVKLEDEEETPKKAKKPRKPRAPKPDPVYEIPDVERKETTFKGSVFRRCLCMSC